MLLVALPLDEVSRTLHQLFVIELVVTGAALLAAIGLGLWLVRLGLRPLRDIETTASSIAGGDLSLRVPEDSRTEVGRLGSSLNTMLRHIEDAFARRAASEEQLRQFVADASHELRTPLSAVSAYAELFERGAHERPADLARVMRGIRVETARMQMLIDDLLLLARLDEGRPLASERVDLVAVLEDAVDAASAVGPDWPITLVADASGRGRRRPDGAPPDHRQPARQRPDAHPPTTAGRAGCVDRATIRARWSWRSPTRVRASTPSTSSGSSSGSTGSTRRDHATGVGAGSGSPSWPRWWPRTTDGSRCRAPPVPARPSGCTWC